MLRILILFFTAILAGGASASDAPQDAALMIRVEGDVQILTPGGEPMPAQPMLRVATGDQLQLANHASVQMVFYRTGIRETWSGSGTLTMESEQGKSDSLSVEKRELPPLMAAQILKIPNSAQHSKAGMVRLRSLKDIEQILQIEANYQEYRKTSAPHDTAPAIYFVSGMLELKQYDRIVEFLDLLEREHPEDPGFSALVAHFRTLLTPDHSPQPGDAENSEME